MSEQHTPGPWISEKSVMGVPPDAGCGVIASDNDVSISNPSRGIVAWASRIVSRTNAETLANARLIAAAPELFDAVRTLIDRLQQSWERRDLAPDGDLEAISAAGAIIAKVTGAAP